MKNIDLNLLKSTSNVKIDLMKNVSKHIKFNKNGKFKYHYIPFANYDLLENFILNLDQNSLYITIPMLSREGKSDNPYLVLSKQFLLSQYSSPEIINKFIMEQLDIALFDFNFELEFDKFFYLILKYKKIELL